MFLKAEFKNQYYHYIFYHPKLFPDMCYMIDVTCDVKFVIQNCWGQKQLRVGTAHYNSCGYSKKLSLVDRLPEDFFAGEIQPKQIDNDKYS